MRKNIIVNIVGGCRRNSLDYVYKNGAETQD